MGLSNVSIQQFNTVFENEYQIMKRKLEGTTVVYKDLTGDAFKLPWAGQLVLHSRGAYHSDVPPTIPVYVRKLIYPNERVALYPTDIFEQTKVNVSERQNLAKTAAWGLGRGEDQEIIDGLNASTTPNTVPVGTTNLTVEKLRQAARALDRNNVPDDNRYYLGYADQKESLLRATETTSSDFNTVKALVNGELNTFLGFKFIWIGDMLEGGLPKTGNNRTNFAWHYDSMATGYWMNRTVAIDWVPTSLSYVVVPRVIIGAGEANEKGIVKIICDETK